MICFGLVDVITWCLPIDQAHALTLFAHVTLVYRVGGASALASERLLKKKTLIYLQM